MLVGGPFFLSSLIFKECSKLITTYDKHKNITQQKLYTSDNQIVDIICFVYEYDSYGNWIKKEEYRGKNEDELLKMNVKERILEYY